MSACMKNVSIKEKELEKAGYVVKKETNEVGTLYFIFRKGCKIVEVLRRKENLKKGKVIVLGSHMMHYCETVKIKVVDNSLKLECHNPFVIVIFF